MTTYVATCDPWYYLWADDPNDAQLVALSVGHHMAQADWSWGCYALDADQFTTAVMLGAKITDRFGPAEWCAVRDNRSAILARIRALRPSQL